MGVEISNIFGTITGNYIPIFTAQGSPTNTMVYYNGVPFFYTRTKNIIVMIGRVRVNVSVLDSVENFDIDLSNIIPSNFINGSQFTALMNFGEELLVGCQGMSNDGTKTATIRLAKSVALSADLATLQMSIKI